ncbi:hypothetical protein [Streptomyces sp. BF23-19]|uniref:hypothetical protein n=1 Tax=Streptomyces TaxID=1883 RepID=UPI0034E4982D|nr:hypothetical protein OG253_05735 [Streptomyces virginiae]
MTLTHAKCDALLAHMADREPHLPLPAQGAEWTCDYGDGRLYRNVTIAELGDGRAVRVTDYWGEPTSTPPWRRPLTARLDMPGDGIWKDHDHLGHH